MIQIQVIICHIAFVFILRNLTTIEMQFLTPIFDTYNAYNKQSMSYIEAE